MKQPAEPLLSLKLPSAWNELSLKELRYMAALLASPMPRDQQRLLALLELSRLNPLPIQQIPKASKLCWFYQKTNRYALEPELLASLMKKMDFLFVPHGLNLQRMPAIRLKGKRYQGPASRLFNLQYQEFIHAEAWLDRYLKSEENSALDQLCAVLYRPRKGWLLRLLHPKAAAADQRIAFDEFGYEKRAQQLAALPAWKKTLICLFYLGGREALFAAHPALQKQTAPEEEDASMLERHKRLMHLLSQGDVTRNEDIMTANVYAVFTTLENMLIDAQRKTPSHV